MIFISLKCLNTVKRIIFLNIVDYSQYYSRIVHQLIIKRFLIFRKLNCLIRKLIITRVSLRIALPKTTINHHRFRIKIQRRRSNRKNGSYIRRFIHPPPLSRPMTERTEHGFPPTLSYRIIFFFFFSFRRRKRALVLL